jgi:hypothetical protein
LWFTNHGNCLNCQKLPTKHTNCTLRRRKFCLKLRSFWGQKAPANSAEW